MEITKPYFAYKGFDKDFKCRGEQFEVGAVYAKHTKGDPVLCTSDGYHYCDKLYEVFDYYPNNGENLFCKIQVMGNYTCDNTPKKITTIFRIIEKLTPEQVQKEEEKLDLIKQEERLRLPFLRDFQEKYPESHIGGSLGLYLQGIQLPRLESGPVCEMDIIFPYFTPILPLHEDDEVKPAINKNSGNDFDYGVSYTDQTTKERDTFNIALDIKIDPFQKYRRVIYQGHSYNVSLPETILEAKIRYMNGVNGEKHSNDFKEIVGITNTEYEF